MCGTQAPVNAMIISVYFTFPTHVQVINVPKSSKVSVLCGLDQKKLGPTERRCVVLTVSSAQLKPAVCKPTRNFMNALSALCQRGD